ncbi:hypothetical protein ACGRHY_28030 [Streptomyces sp. HK10]|uniref:hypothetical protein n=1 Tax=Streptomyces sp. HK10 TaxID=3373255 RepID=UPI003749C48D
MTFQNVAARADLPLPGIGTLAARVTVLEHGCVRYVVHGPHIRGTFVLIPEHFRDGTILPSTVRVQYGDGTGPCGYAEHRPDEPVIYGVRLHGWTGGIDPANVPNGYFLGRYATSLRAGGVHRELTSAVRRRTEAVIRSVTRHWRNLPHLHDLLTAAARPNAKALASHEADLAAQAKAEVAELRQARARACHQLNVITGIIRRAPRPTLAPDPSPVRLPLVDSRKRPMGTVTVREVAVNDDVAGAVVYEVHGARVHGRFTVGRDIYRPLPMPEGIWVAYGHARQRYFEYERSHEPTVNGVRLDGEWNRSTTDGLTAATPADLPAHVRLTRTTGHSAPAATARRASAVLRALALHYLRRPDVEALRLAAAQDHAPPHLGNTRTEIRDLRRQQEAAERRVRRHLAREEQYRALLTADAAASSRPQTSAA